VATVPSNAARDPFSVRSILRVVITVVASVLALYLIYLIRTPLGYLVLASFVAVCASGPVNVLNRHMRRGFAITIVYLGIVLVPIGILAILLPPLIRAGINLVNDLPDYIRDLSDTVEKNEQLQKLNENFDITSKLNDLAGQAASKLGDVAGILADIGAGVVNSLFALVTILVLSIFMVARGREWVEAGLRTRPQHQADRIRLALDHMANAVGNYVGGALLQATVAGVTAFIVLVILGIPSPLALAVVMALLDLIPLVGATLGAILVGIVTLFGDFPIDTIIWAGYAIAYQQFENYVIQPRIQSRAVALDPFIVVVAAIIGGTLLGVIGAVLAIPGAAVVQIGIREYIEYRREYMPGADKTPPTSPAPEAQPP
jgi:predicted PurR-regulated permease PerM